MFQTRHAVTKYEVHFIYFPFQSSQLLEMYATGYKWEYTYTYTTITLCLLFIQI